jgi:hypothetical protein
MLDSGRCLSGVTLGDQEAGREGGDISPRPPKNFDAEIRPLNSNNKILEHFHFPSLSLALWC